jgi:hypothetical protein
MEPHTLHALTSLADGEHPGIIPPLNGAIVFIVLCILLFAVTRLNRDR